MIKYVTLFLLIFLVTDTLGQKIGEYYISVSMDSTQGGRLKFLSDTTVELSSIPRHMSPSLKTVLRYVSTDTTIEILPDTTKKPNTQLTGLYIEQLVLRGRITLTKITRGFIDCNKRLIYVRQKDFPKNPDITYIVDGKTHIQDTGVTDGYGLVKKSPKTNKSLQKRLKALTKDNCTIEVVRGLAAYERFGIDKVFGVIIINTKK
jgi:hypothetical protein